MTKSQPLSKRWGYAQRFSDGTRVLREEEVKEAVRRLQDKIDNLYRKFDKGDVWSKGKDEVCDMCQEYFEKEIKNIFGSLADEVKDD